MLNNEAYMNTGIQRSSSMPRFVKPHHAVGSQSEGKIQYKKT
jgi:pyruvate/2-oxoacid:ferredoxin oxidoreductase beta subunit